VTGEVHTLSGAYALDAVSEREAEVFEKHLAACPACRQEVRELRAAAARMAEVESMSPPRSLKARVLAGAGRQPQLPPVAEQPAATGGRTARWSPRLMAAAAAVVALVVAAGVGYSQLRDDSTPRDRLAVDVVRVFEAPDARLATMETTNGGAVSVATSPSLDRMAVDTERLPALAADEVYQLWTVADGTTVSAGVLEDPDEGATMQLPGDDVAVAITIEPAGGSQAPTDEPIMTVTPSDV